MRNVIKPFLDRLGQRVCDLIDEALDARDLAVIREHQAIIDEIAERAVLYTLTSLAEAAPADAGPEARDEPSYLPLADWELWKGAADAEAAREALAGSEAGAEPAPWEQAKPEPGADLCRGARQERRAGEGQ